MASSEHSSSSSSEHEGSSHSSAKPSAAHKEAGSGAAPKLSRTQRFKNLGSSIAQKAKAAYKKRTFGIQIQFKRTGAFGESESNYFLSRHGLHREKEKEDENEPAPISRDVKALDPAVSSQHLQHAADKVNNTPRKDLIKEFKQFSKDYDKLYKNQKPARQSPSEEKPTGRQSTERQPVELEMVDLSSSRKSHSSPNESTTVNQPSAANSGMRRRASTVGNYVDDSSGNRGRASSF